MMETPAAKRKTPDLIVRGFGIGIGAGLHQALHYLVEDGLTWADALVGQGAEGLVDQVQHVGEAGLLGVEVEDAGEDLVLGVRVHQG